MNSPADNCVEPPNSVSDSKSNTLAPASAAVRRASVTDASSREIDAGGRPVELPTAGGPNVGIDWVRRTHPEVLQDVEFALNEGGRIRVADGRVRTVNVQTTEKVSYNVRAHAEGLLAAAAALAIIIPVEIALEIRESRTEGARRLAAESVYWVAAEKAPTGSEILRAMTSGDPQ